MEPSEKVSAVVLLNTTIASYMGALYEQRRDIAGCIAGALSTPTHPATSDEITVSFQRDGVEDASCDALVVITVRPDPQNLRRLEGIENMRTEFAQRALAAISELLGSSWKIAVRLDVVISVTVGLDAASLASARS